MNPITYWPPLSDAIARTRSLLLQPFDAGRWFVMGFTVWLVYLGQWGSALGGSDPETRTSVRVVDIDGAWDHTIESIADALPTGLSVLMILSLATLALMVAVALLWVSCRARFVWLENLTAGDHQLGAHWTRFARFGDSFFFWKLGYYVLGLAVVAPLVVFGGLLGALGVAGFDGPGSLLGWLMLGMGFFVVAVVLAYVDFFAETFVTVIMHRQGVGVLEAWRRFRVLFERHPGHFVLVGLMKVLLWLLVGAILLALCLVTCCAAYLILILPYLGMVLQLPLYCALRYYDLCWLGQVDPDLALPATAPISPAGPTPGSDPTP